MNNDLATTLFVTAWALIGAGILLAFFFKKSRLPAYVAATGSVMVPYSIVFGFAARYPIIRIIATIAFVIGLIYSYTWMARNNKK